MVEVARLIPSRRAVDGPALIEREQIARAARLAPVGFFVGDAGAAVGRDIGPALDWLDGEDAQSGGGTADPKDSRRHALRIPANCAAVIGFAMADAVFEPQRGIANSFLTSARNPQS